MAGILADSGKVRRLHKCPKVASGPTNSSTYSKNLWGTSSSTGSLASRFFLGGVAGHKMKMVNRDSFEKTE